MLTPPDFIIVPCQLLEEKTLRPIDAVVFGYIYWLDRLTERGCIASNETIAKLCRANVKSIGKSILRLETVGYLKREFADAQRKKRSKITTLVSFGKVPPNGGTVPPYSGISYRQAADRYIKGNKKTINRDSSNRKGTGNMQVNTTPEQLSAIMNATVDYSYYKSAGKRAVR